MAKNSQHKKNIKYLKERGCKIELVTRVKHSSGIIIKSGVNEAQTIAYAAMIMRGIRGDTTKANE